VGGYVEVKMSSEDALEAAAAALLAETAGTVGGGAKNKKKKGKKKKQNDDAQEQPAADANAPPAPPKAQDDDAAELLAELGLGENEESSAAKDKKKKKKKKGGKKEAPAKPQSAVAKLALERMAREKEEAERRAREEEEFRKQEEAEEQARLEKERIEQEKRDKKREKERKKKEELRAQGKAVTKAQKAREAKAKAAREALIAQGLIDLPTETDGKPKKVVYKSKKKNKKGAAASPKAQPEKEKVEEPEPVQEQEEVVEEQEEEVAPVAAPANDDKEEEEDAPDDWDVSSDEDWDAADKLNELKLKMDDDEEEDVAVDLTEDIVKKSTASPSSKKKAVSSNQAKTGKKKKKGKKGGAKKTKQVVESDYSDSEESSDDDDDDRTMTGAERVRLKRLEKEREIEQARERREERLKEALKKRSKEDLRSPICCVMGHVDTGKTKLLDKIRRTNVQEGEAGGITQQIGATYFPMENLKKTTDKLNKALSLEYKVPGLLVIDTPGHESFANLRKRGSSLCDIAILVIDIMHGLEQQTIESINMLRSRKTPFIVALNKVDRLYGWEAHNGAPIRQSLKQQPDHVISEFETRSKQVITQLMEQGLNATLYYDNDDYKRVVSLVPTSAHTGEGIPDLLLLLVQLTQRMMVERLMFSEVMEATVLDVKKIEGVGTTIDIVLVNGKLRKGDTIVVAGMNGPIVTQIRALLTPQPLKEMRVKGDFVHHDEIKAAMGIKISGQHLEDAIAGTSMYLLTDDDDEEELMDAVMADVSEVMQSVSTTGRGVCVQASTLGSLEALMEFLRVSKIPVASVQIGPVHKRDVMRASIMLEHQKEYACILAFDVKVTREAQENAEDLGVRIFTAEIIYHLFDHFTQYLKDIREERKEEIQLDAVFPCILRILPENVFMKKNPLVFGVDVVDGILKIGTPIVVPDKLIPDDENPGQTKPLELGRIVSIEKDGAQTDLVKKGNSVAIKIQGTAAQSYVTFGRHFDENNLLYSELSRKSIDLLKENFKEDLQKTDWQLVIKLKTVFNII